MMLKGVKNEVTSDTTDAWTSTESTFNKPAKTPWNATYSGPHAYLAPLLTVGQQWGRKDGSHNKHVLTSVSLTRARNTGVSSELHVLPDEWVLERLASATTARTKAFTERTTVKMAVAEGTKALPYPSDALDKAPDKRKARSLPWTPPESAQFLQILLFEPATETQRPATCAIEPTQVFKPSYQPNCGRNQLNSNCRHSATNIMTTHHDCTRPAKHLDDQEKAHQTEPSTAHSTVCIVQPPSRVEGFL